jgi:uncharacterized protein (DUF488 family)
MDRQSLYTIGHGARRIEDFLETLRNFSIEYLIDIRSQPYSKFNPQYNQGELKLFLERNGITYVFMGESIGGRPLDPSCYDNEGRVDYEKVRLKEFFLKGIERLKTAYIKNIPIAIMCSESKPSECHRSKLIGRVLSLDKIYLKHIDERNKVKTQAEVINELNKGLSDTTLFNDTPVNGTSRKSYL